MKLLNVVAIIALASISGLVFCASTGGASSPASGTSTPASGTSGAVEQVNVDVTALIQVSTCTGKNATCPVTGTINAIGETAIIDVSKFNVEDLGAIETEKKVTIDLPVKKNGMTVVSFTPTKGELAGKKIFLAFDYIDPRLGSRFVGQNVIKIYRRLEDEKADQWIEVGNLRGKDTRATWEFTAKPEGTLVTFSPLNKKTVEFVLGTRKI